MAPLTHAPARAQLATAPPPPLDLEARLALTDAAMTLRLEQALVRLAVDGEHAETALSPADFSTEALTAYAVLSRPLLDPYPTPVAAVLQLAARRLETDGWCRGATRNASGARCLYGAIRAEASGSIDLESAALDVLVETIRRQFDPDATSVPGFNDSRLGGPRTAVRLMESAARLADARGL